MNSNGFCVECSRHYTADKIEDGLCPRCQAMEPKNDPREYDDEHLPRWRWTRSAMRERLGITGDLDE